MRTGGGRGNVGKRKGKGGGKPNGDGRPAKRNTKGGGKKKGGGGEGREGGKGTLWLFLGGPDRKGEKGEKKKRTVLREIGDGSLKKKSKERGKGGGGKKGSRRDGTEFPFGNVTEGKKRKEGGGEPLVESE